MLTLALGCCAPCFAFGEEVNTVYPKVRKKRNYRFKEKSQDDSSCHKLKNFLIAAAGVGFSAVAYLCGKKSGFSDGLKKGSKTGYDTGAKNGYKAGYDKGSEDMLDDILYPFLDEKTEFEKIKEGLIQYGYNMGYNIGFTNGLAENVKKCYEPESEEIKNSLVQFGYSKGLYVGLIEGLKNCNNPDYAMLKLIAEDMPL